MPLQRGREVSYASFFKNEDAGGGEEIRPDSGEESKRITILCERDFPEDANLFLSAETPEVCDGCKMNVRSIVPFPREGFCFRHIAEEELSSGGTVTEIDETDDSGFSAAKIAFCHCDRICLY